MSPYDIDDHSVFCRKLVVKNINNFFVFTHKLVKQMGVINMSKDIYIYQQPKFNQ